MKSMSPEPSDLSDLVFWNFVSALCSSSEFLWSSLPLLHSLGREACNGHVSATLVGGSRVPQCAYPLQVPRSYPQMSSLSFSYVTLWAELGATSLLLRLILTFQSVWSSLLRLPNFGEVILCARSCAQCVEIKYKRFVFLFYMGCTGYWACHTVIWSLGKQYFGTKLFNFNFFWL